MQATDVLDEKNFYEEWKLNLYKLVITCDF
jgi:hypothetical protein